MIAALLLGLLIVGMVGGGGAVLAVPALVYAVGLDVHAATTARLAVVAAGAATGAVGRARRGAVCWSSAACSSPWVSSAPPPPGSPSDGLPSLLYSGTIEKELR
jgi:uncharacterized membrane protein YfcA